ncbi:MAG: DUF2914 domain-containing protein [Pseudomonadota bacterium]
MKPFFILLFIISYFCNPLFAQQKITPDSFTQGSVARAIFTTEIQNREPINNLKTQTNDINKMYFFTELVGFNEKVIKHRWIYMDEVKAELSFSVRGERWRVFSSKNLIPSWIGTWTVQVVDESGQVLKSASFDYMTANPVNELDTTDEN